jgi:hypothetical protein
MGKRLVVDGRISAIDFLHILLIHGLEITDKARGSQGETGIVRYLKACFFPWRALLCRFDMQVFALSGEMNSAKNRSEFHDIFF